MTDWAEHQAAEVLRERYDAAPERDKMLAIHLFGIEFADRLDGLSINKISELALDRQLGPQIRAGMKLAKYVRLK
ncbi:HTH-like domain-containing protein [Algicella marina]|uniref:HTH-like domain-containing protein n=1 Tax=Algicella marina TaxID=2683284 RepID=A0A6P1T0K1_9RHOB|nr:hypothetical protein [Algicella marina]QHQ34819.1 hypothetical protein GO499_06205 [Algicella marina]